MISANHEAMKKEAIRERQSEALADLKYENKIRKQKGLKPLPKKPFWKK